MRRRNPDPTRSPRRGWGLALPLEARRARLWRRWGWPRGFAMRGEWFCGVDVGRASDAWVTWVHALPPRPRGSPHAAAGRAWLEALAAVRAQAAREPVAQA